MQKKPFNMDAGCPSFPTSDITQRFHYQDSCLPNNLTSKTDTPLYVNCECNHEPYQGGEHSSPFHPSYIYPSHITEHYQQDNGHWQECQQEHWNPSMDTQNLFLAGYMDCAREALRYLTEDEGLTSSHPTVTGLRSHLTGQSHMTHLQYLLQSGALLGETDSKHSVDETHHVTNSDPTELRTTNTIHESESHSLENDGVAYTDIDSTNSDDSTEVQIHTTADVPHRLRFHIEMEHIHRTCSESTEFLSSQEEPANTQDSKERIAAKLAEEIFQLLQGDISMSDDDFTDDEGESSDEGFDEIIDQ